MVISEKARKSVSIKIFAVTLVILLAVTAIVSYLGYSAITKLQTDQNALQSKYDGLSSQYFGLQADFSELQKNNSDLQGQLTTLQSQFSTLQSQQDILRSNYSALQSQQDILQSQHYMLQANYSTLQTQQDILEAKYSALQSQQNILQANYSTLKANYTKFMADYQQSRSTPFSYLVFTDGNGNYYAENGTTKTIEYSGTDLASILNAVLTPGKTCHFLPGDYYLNSTVNVFGKNDVSISGSGLETSVIQVPSDICAFNITGTDSDAPNARFSMSNIAINSTSSSTQPAIFIKYMNDIKLGDLSVTAFNVGYDIECTEKVYIHRCKVWSNKTTFSTGFKFVGYSIDIFLTDTIVLHNQPSGVGYSFNKCDSITLMDAIANPTITSYGDGGYGFFFFDCHWVNLIGTLSDGNGNHGYYLSSGFGYYFTGAWAGSNFGNGLYSEGAGQIILSGCSFYTNHMDGIKLNNSANTTISTIISKGNTENGLEVSNTKGITVTSSILTQNGNKGIFLDAGNSYAIVQNNNCLDNSDPLFDIYISTPHSRDTSLVSNNFGRIYQRL
jgi:chaperonin cofactor prefoldin